MFTEDKVTEIFFRADEFCKFFGSLAKPCVNRNKLHYKLPRLVCEESIAREVYGYQLRGQPPPSACVQEPAHSHAQSIQGHRCQGNVLHGVVLRLQAARGLQREDGVANHMHYPRRY